MSGNYPDFQVVPGAPMLDMIGVCASGRIADKPNRRREEEDGCVGRNDSYFYM